MTLKSLLPSSSSESNGQSLISRQYADKGVSDQSNVEQISSSLSSSVKKSSPLATSCIQVNTDSSTSTQSWITHRWSTISGSLVIQQNKKKKSAKSSWKNRKKRRTYPPSKDILKQEQIKFLRNGNRKHSALYMVSKKQQRQSLADILPAFYATLQNQSSTGGSSSSSSSLSKKIGRMMKKKGKQPFNLKELHINTTPSSSGDKIVRRNGSDLSNVIDDKVPFSPFVFKPPPTISSKSSSPSTPLKLLPPPPRRFSAFFVDASGKSGKVKFHSRPRLWFFNRKRQKGVGDEEKGESTNETSVKLSTELCLFLFGFLLFPLWWIGVWLYFRSNRASNDRSLSDLFTTRTLAYLNLLLSGASIVLIIVVIAMLVWYKKY